ncbi:hypothetical protein CONLIGDRAFT_569861 [Coniochaeta ligniaria NRRL 30616]|uniref:RNA-dependent RNA polymerase n=1 Tax=Coniochaeta ligniaria NRRL 30616 TaxID=1408157 RepID=A0A1J7JHQ8_9PEZI|nr:hypothetical protein CONLIGDRAFT_569861 [Coniochaeta ligniaria NRRL 30616]
MGPRATVRPEPSTPKKPHSQGVARVDAIINDLNADYNLGIEICDKSLTPSHRRERAKIDNHFARSDKISRILQQIYYQAGEDSLGTALEAFHRESKAVCRKWIPKPRADRDTLPSSSSPCRATTPGEQNELQEILVYILEQLRQALRPGPTRDGPTDDGFAIPSRPSQSRSKRLSDEGLQGTSKRVKERQLEPGHVATTLDKVPARKKVGRDDPPDLNPRRSIFQDSSRSFNRSFYEASANTSKASLIPSIFSNVENEPLPASQSTVDPDTQEPKKPSARHGLAPLSSAADSFAPSSGDIRALDESFSHFAERDGESPLTEYSEFSGLLDIQMPDVFASLPSNPLEARLKNIWPKSPRWQHQASLAVVWEFTRICLHCGLDVDEVEIPYDLAWENPQSYLGLWSSLRKHASFSSKAFPEPPDTNAWTAAMKGFRLQSMAVIMSASVDFNPSKDGPLFLVRLSPLRLEKGCRLNRRFGSDRFFEVLMPSTNSRAVPEILKDDVSVRELVHWLTRTRHSIFGRQWAAFFAADAGYRKQLKELRTSPDAKPVFKERIHFFAEYGNGFTESQCHDALPVSSVEQMLDWLLQFKRNEGQPFLKLFSRIQLGLSKTDPVVVLEKRQIRHHPGDILSPTNKVMNDGIARVSVSIARKVQEALGLSDLPSAIQGRMGSAKGMWIVDVADGGSGEDWIETYLSQRKWDCEQTDPYHRTLEVHGVSHELRSASLNLQFLPVLEDRAKDRGKMRDTIGQRMADDLHEELTSLKSSMRSPLEFRHWVHSNGSSARAERVQHGQVPFLGGLPKRTEETINFLLDGGFDPKKQSYLQELAWKMQLQKCEVLKTKLNIRVGRSAYIYMVVDFWNVLEENEVHVAFSSKFQDPQGKFSDILLHDVDVLVARSPAHLVSDIQRVKAVFKTELRALKDVIVFSAKGNTPLADKLSGGDYDGDKAWVCWDPDIVDNFVNADVPEPPDLSSFVRKDKTTFGDLVHALQGGRKNRTIAIQDMIEKSFRFNMAQSFLGQCTNYKEKLCYRNDTVRDEASLFLSTLLSNLVDQAKQGILFGSEDWDRLRKHLRIPIHLDDPAYKFDNWSGKRDPSHIIDHLKFTIVKKTIDQQLEAVYKELNPGGTVTPKWDEDLAKPFDHFQNLAETSKSCQNLLDGLKNSLGSVFARWGEVMGKDKDKDNLGGNETTYPQRVTEVYDMWHAIEPTFYGRQTRSQDTSKVVSLLIEPYLTNDRLSSYDMPYELSNWSVLKASATFKLYYKKRNRFVWQLAGRQLQAIKAKVNSAKAGQVPVLVGPLMYAGLTVDKRFVAQYVAMREGQNSEYLGLEDKQDDEEEDDA